MKMRSIVALTGAAAAAIAVGVPAQGASVTKLKSSLTAGQEVPTHGPRGASARVELAINRSTGRVCWQFTHLSHLSKRTAAHIHAGKKGKAGPVAVPLGSRFTRKGCTTTQPATAASIVRAPSIWYVNVHTSAYPNGAARGQLHKDR